jgi:hypothetical protein
MGKIREKLLSMEIGSESKIQYKAKGFTKEHKKLFTRINDTEWVLEGAGKDWSIAYLDIDNAVAYLEGKIKGYELNWE